MEIVMKIGALSERKRRGKKKNGCKCLGFFLRNRCNIKEDSSFNQRDPLMCALPC